MHLGVLHGDEWGLGRSHASEEGRIVQELRPAIGVTVQPLDPRVGEVGARWVGDHEIPAQILDKGGVSLVVGNGVALGRPEVASGDIGSSVAEHFGNGGGGFTNH